MMGDNATPGDQQAGFVIKITCVPNQPITVSSEPINADQSADDTDMSGQPANDWKSAMALATQLYKNSGQSSSVGADEQAGFDSVVPPKKGLL